MALSYMICIDILMYHMGKLRILQTVAIKHIGDVWYLCKRNEAIQRPENMDNLTKFLIWYKVCAKFYAFIKKCTIQSFSMSMLLYY